MPYLLFCYEWTKKLSYVWWACWLNSCQVEWALFLGRFQFTTLLQHQVGWPFTSIYSFCGGLLRGDSLTSLVWLQRQGGASNRQCRLHNQVRSQQLVAPKIKCMSHLLLQPLPVPVSKLPSTFETARLLIISVFCLQGIPQDLSDHGPWYLSCLEGLHPSISLVVPTAGLNEWTRIWRLRCSATHLNILPSSLLTLPGFKYTHNSLVSSSTGMSPIMAVFNPLFRVREDEVAGPSIQHSLRRAQLRGRPYWLCQTAAWNQLLADQQAPNYQPGQEEWLPSWDLPLQGSPYVYGK